MVYVQEITKPFVWMVGPSNFDLIPPSPPPPKPKPRNPNPEPPETLIPNPYLNHQLLILSPPNPTP